VARDSNFERNDHSRMRSPIRQAGILLGIYVTIYLAVGAAVQVVSDPAFMAALAATSTGEPALNCTSDADPVRPAPTDSQWVGD